MAAAQQGALVVVHRAQVSAIQHDRAFVPAVQPRHAVEQGRFAHARLPDDGDEFSRCHVERDVAENGGFAITLAQLTNFQTHKKKKW